MSCNISNALFKEVMMHFKFSNVSLIGLTKNRLEYKFHDLNLMQNEYIPVAEFFFKCKEWALKQGYMIVTFGNGYFIYNIKELYDPMEELDKWIEDGLSASEQQAVFDACMYILENKEK